MAINLKGLPWVVPVRVVQAVFALIVLALTAYGTSIFVGSFFPPRMLFEMHANALCSDQLVR